ncbi:MAG: DUF975 family protein [Oscillospiraceae bacterium]|nr:DUF975 family protein [Oscillospiraceae bacterium]
MFSVRLVKKDARSTIMQVLASVIMFSLAYSIIAEVLSMLSTKISYGNLDFEAYYNALMSGVEPELPETSPYGSYLTMAIFIMITILGAGFMNACLLVSRKRKAGIGEMFDVFAIFGRVMGVTLLSYLYTFLWSLLFIIPGIVASYRYSMAVYIVLERNDVSISDSIRMSKEMTMGSKAKLFLLDMSFLPWTIVSYAGVFIFPNSMALITAWNIIIRAIWLPYHGVSHANAYNILSNWQPEADVIIEEIQE